jgi:ribosomal protein S18 acetylase RimI-like enzyme
MQIRKATKHDDTAIWQVIEPIIRAGETYTLPREMTRAEALSYWISLEHETFVVENANEILGTYYMRANQRGGGAHVANCGYMTAPHAFGRGIAKTMCAHSLGHARDRGFRAMQFNFVVSTNEGAVRLWQSFHFDIVGRLPEAFYHPRLGYVDALVMYRML